MLLAVIAATIMTAVPHPRIRFAQSRSRPPATHDSAGATHALPGTVTKLMPR